MALWLLAAVAGAAIVGAAAVKASATRGNRAEWVRYSSNNMAIGFVGNVPVFGGTSRSQRLFM